MHANPYLRSLQLNAIAARGAAAAPAPTDATVPQRPELAAVADLPASTPVHEHCPTAVARIPTRDGNRLVLGKLFADLQWAPDPGTELTVSVARDASVLFLDGAAPGEPVHDCGCEHCDADHATPTDRLLDACRRLPGPASVQAKGRVRLSKGHLAALAATDAEPLAAVGLFDLGLLAIGTATDLLLHGALAAVRIPDA